MTETSFTIDELEELYALFKVSLKVNPGPPKGMEEFALMIQWVPDLFLHSLSGRVSLHMRP